MKGGEAPDRRVLLLAPSGRDAELAAALLRESGVESCICPGLGELCDELLGGAGAIVLTEEALASSDLRRLSAWLEGQPPWSDMPFVVLTRRAGDLQRNPGALRLMELLGNVSFLERPFHPTTFVSMVRVALRARGRQLQIREHLDRQLLLTAELDHRVKNMLAVIQALILQTSSGAQSLDEFAENLRGRLNAMSQTHSLLSESHWEGAGIRNIVEGELAAYRSADGANVAMSGPAVLLTPRAAAAVSMAIHELATNAAKYGAFSTNSGRVLVEWSLSTPEEQLSMRWVEEGGPRVRNPRRRGFGTTVIERSLVYELNGSAKLDFLPDGVVCRLAIPMSQLVRGGGVKRAPAAPVQASARMEGERRVLVVEDSALLAMQVIDAVSGLGWRVIGPANRLPEALSLAEAEPLDGAVLDINLDGEFVYPVAEVLQRRGVPFVFASGYVGRSIMPSRFHGAPFVEKPFRAERLQAAMRQTFAQQQHSRVSRA